jgi:hypothetical protein
MSASTNTVLTDRDHQLREWETMLTDNLGGRRVLERVEQGVEPEPATLAQLGSTARINDVVCHLRASHHVMAEAAELASGAIVAALVAETARRAENHVATWEAGQRALGTLADLLEQLASISADPAAPASSARTVVVPAPD